MKQQILEKEGRLPKAVIACVGGGSNAIGAFYEFIPDRHVCLIGVEAGGRGTALGEHAARFSGGAPGVLQGTYSYVLQDETGRSQRLIPCPRGRLCSVGPEHATLHDRPRSRILRTRGCAEAVVKLGREESSR